MPRKQEWIAAAGIGALLITVLVTLLMQQPSAPVLVSVQTETPPVTLTGTAQSAAANTKKNTPATSVSVSRTAQSTTEVLQCTTPDYNLNTADEVALQEVSGVGAVLAAEITAYRDSIGGFTRRSQLLEIPGIGETLAARIMEIFYIPDELPDEEPPEPELPDTENAPAEPQEQDFVMIDLNTAEMADLMKLPDMTESLAERILKLREDLGGFQNPSELLLIPEKEMKPAYFEHTLREHIYIAE